MSPRRLNRLARAVLVVGVAIAMTCMVSGLLWLVLSGKPFAAAGIGPLEIPAAIASGDPNALIDLGIVALVATPFLRVLAVLGLAAAEGDRDFVLISAAVVGLVLLAVLIGMA
jgi:uncharacterized membrane protein